MSGRSMSIAVHTPQPGVGMRARHRGCQDRDARRDARTDVRTGVIRRHLPSVSSPISVSKPTPLKKDTPVWDRGPRLWTRQAAGRFHVPPRMCVLRPGLLSRILSYAYLAIQHFQWHDPLLIHSTCSVQINPVAVCSGASAAAKHQQLELSGQ